MMRTASSTLLLSELHPSSPQVNQWLLQSYQLKKLLPFQAFVAHGHLPVELDERF